MRKLKLRHITLLNVLFSSVLFSLFIFEPLILKNLFQNMYQQTQFRQGSWSLLLILGFEVTLTSIYFLVFYVSHLKRALSKNKVQRKLINNVSSNRKKIDQKIFATAWNNSIEPYVEWSFFKNHKLIFLCTALMSIFCGMLFINPLISLTLLVTTSIFILKNINQKKLQSKRFSKLNEFITQKDFYIDRDTIEDEKNLLLKNLDKHNKKETQHTLSLKLNTLFIETYWMFSGLACILVAHTVLKINSVSIFSIICLSTYRVYILLKRISLSEVLMKKPTKQINQIDYYLKEESYKAKDQDIKRALHMFKNFNNLTTSSHYLLLVSENRIQEAKFLFKIWLEHSPYNKDWSIIDDTQTELETLKQTTGVSFFNPSKMNIEAALMKDFRDLFNKSFSIDSLPKMAFEDTEVFYLDKDQKIKNVKVKDNFSRLSGDKGLVLSNWKGLDPSFDTFHNQVTKVLKNKSSIIMFHTFFEVDEKFEFTLNCPTGGKIVLTENTNNIDLSKATFVEYVDNKGSFQENSLKIKNFLANSTYLKPGIKNKVNPKAIQS